MVTIKFFFNDIIEENMLYLYIFYVMLKSTEEVVISLMGINIICTFSV